jgi:hypothetical protein
MDAASIAELSTALPLAEAACRLLQHVAEEERLDRLFAQHRGRGYEKLLRFPQLVEMIGAALLEAGGSGYRIFSRVQEAGQLPTSMVAVYGKRSRLNVPLSMAFLSQLSDPLRELFPRSARREPPRSLRTLATIILDGKAIKNVAKRLKPLRGVAGGLVGGRALVALEHATGLALAFHGEADGDANDARFVPALLPVIRQRVIGPRLWLADRGFCDLVRLAELTQAEDHFLLRFHPKNSFHPDPQQPLRQGHDAHQRRFVEAWGWLGAATHRQRRYVRRITLHREGEEEVILVTDLLSAQDYPATELLEHYQQRWGVERVFQQVTETFGLKGLIGGTPEATLFQFAFCLLLYNVMQTLRGFVASHQQRNCETISLEKLFVDVREEWTAWSVLVRRELVTLDHFHPQTTAQLGTRLHQLLGQHWSDRWIKAENKKPRPTTQRSRQRTHASVHRLLQAVQQRC